MKHYQLTRFCTKLITCYFLMLAFSGSYAQTTSQQAGKVLPHGSKGFIENKGQINDQNKQPNNDVLYLFNSPGMNIQLRKAGFSYDTYVLDAPNGKKEMQCRYHRVDVDLVNSDPDAQILAEVPGNTYFNYFPGSDGKGITQVHVYQKITYQNIYPHIDLVFRVGNNKPEYDFIVHPGGNVKDLVLQYKGMNQLEQKAPGELGISVSQGNFSDVIPLSYEMENRNKVEVRYNLSAGNRVTFAASPYNTNNTLVIDPTPNLIWGSYFGGSNLDYGLGIALDPSGNVLITGQTISIDNIATTGAYQDTAGGIYYECYVAKLSADGSQLLWGTYYAGTNAGQVVATDASGNVFVAGATGNTNVNLSTPGAYQTSWAGGSDAYVAKFSADGTQLLWGTYYGGPDDDGVYGITVDKNNNVLITGYTRSYTGVTTPGVFQNIYGGGGFNAFVAKFSNSGSMVWSSYYGGTVDDQGICITTDTNSNVLLAGLTQSTGIATVGAYQTVLRGSSNTFVASIKSDGTRLLWSTYYGGSGDETYPSGIITDKSGNILVSGYTNSIDYIATPGAYMTDTLGGLDAYVAKFNSTGSQLLWGTYYGGSGYNMANGIAVDAAGNALITGSTTSADHIATPGAYQTFYKNSNDTYLAKLSADGTALIWGTYFSVPYQDQGQGIVTDGAGNILITGFSGGYPGDTDFSTPGAYQIHNAGYGDAYVAKFSNGGCTVSAGIAFALPDTICPGDSVKLATTGSSGNIQWQSSAMPGNFANINNATGTSLADVPLQTTYYRVYAATGSCADTSVAIQVLVHPAPATPVLTPADSIICSSDSTIIHSSGPYSSYLWNNGDTRSYTYTSEAGGYWVTVKDTNGCMAVSPHVTIAVYAVPSVSITVQGDTLSSLNANAYQWYVNDTAISGATGAIYIASQSGNYSVEITDTNGCKTRSNDTHVSTGITGPDELTRLNVYPDPFTNTILVSANNGAIHIESIHIYNVLGENVVSKLITGLSLINLPIDVSQLPSGVYVLEAKSGNGSYLKKMVKE